MNSGTSHSKLEITHDPESPPPFAGGSHSCSFFTGRFGDLCCGCLQLPGRQELPVAVHTLRDGCSDSQRLSFLAEALTLGQFDHSHIVRLEGVVTRGRAWRCASLCSAGYWVGSGTTLVH